MCRRIFNEKPNAQISTSAYLLNMTIRLKAMKRVLKKTGSIYLHCDPTASHYLKLIMDAIFGESNFRNEIIWYYKNASRGKKKFANSHDIIFWYGKSQNYKFNRDKILVPFESGMTKWRYTVGGQKGKPIPAGKTPDDVIELPSLNAMAKERLGYPTQKPLELLYPIIEASSNDGELVLDPFCGCGTTLHAAEELNRKWIGIDISQFAAGLVRNRLLNEFKQLNRGQIHIIGCPLTLVDAQDLAKSNPFEFEKWICGEVGARGLFHEPGERGSDGGVDGVIPFYHSEELVSRDLPKKTFAIVQVKGGKVNSDSVRALSTTVRQTGAKCGVMICFEKYMRTVENNREKGQIKDMMGNFNFIQGLSVEKLIEGELPNIPGIRKVA